MRIIDFLKNRPMIGYAIISAFYFFGIVGILSVYKEWFIEKTAFNLFLSFLVLIIYQKEYKLNLLLSLAICYVLGFLAEYVGVNYGLIFGNYHYPDTLGPQIAGVPVIIGINWFLLSFTIWSVLDRFLSINKYIKVLIATIAIVFIDVMIEPVAIQLNFWQWENNEIPLQNYLGWAIVSFAIFMAYSYLKVSVKNVQALVLLIWQIVFFAALNILL